MKTCKHCRKKLLRQHAVFCISCKKYANKFYYKKRKKLGLVPKHISQKVDRKYTRWACNCFDGLGHIIPVEYYKCAKCKTLQYCSSHTNFITDKVFNPDNFS